MAVTIRKLLAALAGACALLAAGQARAWNAGTHAWIAAEMHKKAGLVDPAVLPDRIYGANALDLFNNDFTDPALTLQRWLHESPPDGLPGMLFLEVWEEADAANPRQVAFAYGVVTHNNLWGADSTAHVSGVTYGHDVGWIVAKGRILGAMLDPALQQNGLFLTPAQLEDVGHILVEQAVDLLMLQLDPHLGEKLMGAAALRDPAFADLLVEAWVDDFAAVVGSHAAAEALIRAYEAGLRTFLMEYGWALSQPDALSLLAGQIAVMAEGYLGLPPGSGAALVPLIEQAIQGGMQLCAGDFQREVRATAGWVNGRMSRNGVAF